MTTNSKITRAAAPVVAAFAAAEKAQVKVGDAVLAAATKLSEADIKPFCDAIKTSLENKGFTPNSAKVTTMYIRRVLTAVIVDGLEIEPGQTLRGLYDSLPKSATGGASHTRKMNKGASDSDSNDSEPEENDDAEPAPTTLEARAEKVRAAVTMIFGYSEPELLDAVQVAAANIAEFIRWAKKSSVLAEVEKAIVPNMEQSTPAKKSKRKEPATA